MHEIYKGKKILVTGCRGFKGSWMVLWLQKLGSEVIGYGHFPPTYPNHHDILNLSYNLREELLDHHTVNYFIEDQKPDLVFHLAAHAIVAKCFEDPRETFENNIMACTNLLDACRKVGTKGVVFVTTDKVYEDENWIWGYRENDKLGGLDPYSASKVCMEHIIRCYRESYGMNIAVARAGNVIGGGDWSEKRLIPDIMKATAEGKKVIVHTPNATRPWQHVLSALDGYLLLGENILDGKDVNSAWNFGPEGEMSVLDVLKAAKRVWDKVDWIIEEKETHKHMVNLLKIDSTKARKLGWNPPWNMEKSIEKAVDWYRQYYEQGAVISRNDIEDYEKGI